MARISTGHSVLPESEITGLATDLAAIEASVTTETTNRTTADTTHAAAATGVHGVGASTVESIIGSQAKATAAQAAAQAYADSALSALVAAAPSTLDTLNELATALGDDPNFATTITNLIAAKATAFTRTAVKTGAYAAAANEYVPVDTTGGNVPITLPNSAADKSRVCVKHIIQGGTNIVTIACAGADVYNKAGGVTTATLFLVNQAITVEYNLANHIWTVVNDDLPLSGLDTRFAPATGSTSYAPRATESVKTADFTAVDGGVYEVDCTNGPVVATVLHAANAVSTVKKIDVSTNSVTLSPDSGTIDGKVSHSFSRKDQAVSVIGDGTNVQMSATRREFAAGIPRYPLIVKRRGVQVLALNIIPSFTEHGVQPEQLLRTEAGAWYIIFQGTGAAGPSRGLIAKSTAGPYGPYSDPGAYSPTGLAPHVVFDGGLWYMFNASTTSPRTIDRWVSANNNLDSGSAWTKTVGVLAAGAAGSPGDWDADGAHEPFVMRDPRPGQTQWLMFYMGINTHVSPQSEQIGLATAPTLTGSWTKVTSLATPPFSEGTGSGLIIPATGVNTSPDGAEVSDPWVVYVNGVFYCFYSAANWDATASQAYMMVATATDPINGPWTKQGICMERGIWPAVDACELNRGSFFWSDDDVIYYPYEGRHRSAAISGSYSLGYMAEIDPASFVGGPRQSPWVRVEAEATDARIVKVGTWASEANIKMSADHDIFSNTTNDTCTFHFEGRRIRVAGQASATNGTCSISLDGATPVTQDMYDADGNAQTPCLIYDSGEIPAGYHKVTLTVTGKNVSASNSYLILDYFEYVP